MAVSRFNRIRSGLANLIDPNKVVRNKFNESFLWALGGGYTNYDTSNKTYIEKGYNINPIVFSVINQMATKTAAIPYYIKKIEDKQSHNKLNSLLNVTKHNLSTQQKVKKAILESKAFAKDDMVFPMDRPNISQTWTEWLSLYKTFLKTTGNVYIYIVSPDEGPRAKVPLQIYLLPSHLTQIIVKDNADLMTIEDPVSGYMMTSGQQYIEFKSCDVIHIKYPNPNYDENGTHLYGQSPLRAAIKNIESSNKGLDLNIKTLKSGGAFGFIHGKQTPLTPDQASELKGRLTEMNTSTEDLARISGISAEVGFTRVSLTTDELRPFDYLNFDQKQICNVLMWSDKLLNNDDGSKYDNVSQFRKQVITDNIMPDLKLLADAFNKEFLPRFKGYENTVIIFDAMELPEMQQDVKALTEWLNTALDRGVITRNEYRLAINYLSSDDVDMDEFTVQNDVMKLSEALDNDFNLNG